MAGKYGMVYWDGEPLVEVSSFTAKVKTNREDVDMAGALATDSKMTGFAGEYTLKVKKIFSRGQIKFALAIREGRDVRTQIVGKLADPDAYGSERVILYNCWLNELTLMDFENGKLGEEEFSGGFTDYSFPDLVAPR
jgi:hypothetical protein